MGISTSELKAQAAIEKNEISMIDWNHIWMISLVAPEMDIWKIATRRRRLRSSTIDQRSLGWMEKEGHQPS